MNIKKALEKATTNELRAELARRIGCPDCKGGTYLARCDRCYRKWQKAGCLEDASTSPFDFDEGHSVEDGYSSAPYKDLLKVTK